MRGTPPGTKDSYIDNFRRQEQTAALAKTSARAFFKVCDRYSVTINESLEEIISSIGKPYDFIGVHYDGNTVSLTSKTKEKLQQCLADVQLISSWTFGLAESVFGLVIFASSVIRVPTPQFYYIYKFFRRRHGEIHKGTLSRNSLAHVWPCTQHLFIEWITMLINSVPVAIDVTTDTYMTAVLITDASEWGYGAVYFDCAGAVSTSGGPWPEELLRLNPPIVELEGRSFQLGLRRHHTIDDKPKLTPVRGVVDNTSLLYGVGKGRSKNFFLNAIIAQVCEFNVISLQYLRSERMIADGLSRGEQFNPALLTNFVDANPALNMDLLVDRRTHSESKKVLANDSHELPISARIETTNLLEYL